MRVNLFTNATRSAPRTATIERTVNSLRETFGPQELRVYCDPHPRPADEYIKRLEGLFGPVTITKGLPDGYRQSLKDSDDEFVLQLEHDWLFNGNITHSLEEIVEAMRSEGLYYLRFNRLHNVLEDWERKYMSFMTEKQAPNGMVYCLMDCLSNNPHIVNRQYYLDNIYDLIDPDVPGIGRVESILMKTGFEGALYGGLGQAPTITHTDGRKA